MISLEKYNDKTHSILEPTEIELKIDYKSRQHLLIFDQILLDSFNLDIKNVIDNPNLKEINISFSNALVLNELLNIFNDKNHLITDIKIGFKLMDATSLKNVGTKIMELKQTVMCVNEVEIDSCGNMNICLYGHMVV